MRNKDNVLVSDETLSVRVVFTPLISIVFDIKIFIGSSN